MRIGKIFPYFGQKSNAQNSTNKQDLTSFGVENRTQLLSKESATALKNKFMADVSFTGYFRNVNIKYKGKYKDFIVGTKEYYEYVSVGTCGASMSGPRNLKYYENKKKFWEKKGCSANINGQYEGSYSESGKNVDDTVREVIKNSDNYIEGSEIKGCISDYETAPSKIEPDSLKSGFHYFHKYKDIETGEECNPDNLYLNKCEDKKVRVYFSDPDEKINKEIIEEADCVVYAPGAEIKKDEPQKPEPTPEPKPEPPQKKSLWQRIFG